MSAEDDKQDRKIEKLEERVNKTERELAALTAKLDLVSDDLSRRIININDNLKADAEKTRLDLRERINDLKANIKGDINDISDAIDDLEETVSALNKSLQGLYITQKGSHVKVNVNEKIIWAIVGTIGAIGLVYIQELIRVGGAS